MDVPVCVPVGLRPSRDWDVGGKGGFLREKLLCLAWIATQMPRALYPFAASERWRGAAGEREGKPR